jgi:hypothetical protein
VRFSIAGPVDATRVLTRRLGATVAFAGALSGGFSGKSMIGCGAGSLSDAGKITVTVVPTLTVLSISIQPKAARIPIDLIEIPPKF